MFFGGVRIEYGLREGKSETNDNAIAEALAERRSSAHAGQSSKEVLENGKPSQRSETVLKRKMECLCQDVIKEGG